MYLNNIMAAAVIVVVFRVMDAVARSGDASPWSQIFTFGVVPMLGGLTGHFTMGGALGQRLVAVVLAVTVAVAIEGMSIIREGGPEATRIWQTLPSLVIIQGSIVVAWFMLFRQVSRRRAVQ